MSTHAISTALGILGAYLAAPAPGREAPPPGGVVMVDGGPGTGKTHLIVRLLRECLDASERTGSVVRPVGIAAAGLDVDLLYHNFVSALPLSEVIMCVRRCYADVVAELITNPEIADRVQQVVRDPALSSDDLAAFVMRLGLSQADVLDEVRPRLADVVGDGTYAAVLTLLLRDGLEGAVGEWLRGAPPVAVLYERGITEPARADLSSIGVFARLYGRQGCRLVLFVDDVDLLDLGSDRERSKRAFRTMLDVLWKTGGMAFLSGRTAGLDRLGLERSGRTGARIVLTGFDEAGAEEYLRERSETGTLSPFRGDAVKRIVDLTGGNPRVLEEFRDRLVLSASRSGEPVSGTDVTQAARSYFAVTDRPRVEAAVRRVLDSNLWEFRTRYAVTVEPAVRVDFWIPVASAEPAGCAVVIAESVLDLEDVKRYVEIADALARGAARWQAVVVTIGATSSAYSAQLFNAFGRQPLSYFADSFAEDLAGTIKAMVHTLDEGGSGDVLAGVRERMSDFDRQQNRTQDMVAQCLQFLGELRDRLDSSATAVGETDDRFGPPELRRVRQVFSRVRQDLVNLGSAVEATSGLFEDGQVSDHAMSALRSALLDPDRRLRALGALSLVTAVVAEFERAVESWFRGTPDLGTLELDRLRRIELDRLCERYEETLEWLPLGEVERLSVVVGEQPGAVRATTWRSRFEATVRQLRRLAIEVRAIALDRVAD